MNLKKVLLFVGVAGAAYWAYRVVRSADGLSQTYNIPGVGMSTPSDHPWSEALKSQGLPIVPLAAFIAYKVF